MAEQINRIYRLWVVLFWSPWELCLSLLSFWDSWVPTFFLKVILAQLWFLPFQHFLQCALENIAAESGGSWWLVFVRVLFLTIFRLIWLFIIHCWCLLLVIPRYKLYSGQDLTLNNCMTMTMFYVQHILSSPLEFGGASKLTFDEGSSQKAKKIQEIIKF